MTTNSTLLSKNLIKRSIYLLFSVGVTVWIFSYLFSVVSLDEVLNAIGKSSPYYLLLFLFFSMIMSIGRTWRYLLFLNISGHNTGRFAMFLVTLARNFFSDLLPARLGTLVYIYLVQARLGVPFDAAASSFALSFIFDILVLGLLVIGASLLVSSALISQGIMIAASLFALVVCTMVLLLLPTVLLWMGRRISRFSWIPETMRGRLERSLVATGAEINHIRSQKIYARALALSVVVRLGKYLSLYALLLAIVVPLGYAAGEFPFSKVFLGLCGAELSASLPISGIAGFGAYEGAWTLVFQMLGYGAKLSALTSVAHHLISQIYGYSLGAIAMITLLLPFFKGDFNNLSQRSVGQAVGHFWLRYAGLFFIIGLVYLVAFSHPSVGNADTKTDTPSTGQQANQSKLPAGRVVFTKSDGIYVKQLGGGSAKRILSNGTYPRWSPDGHKIAFVQGGRIGVHDMTDGSTTFLAQAENPRAVVFNDTGESVFYTDGKVVYAVDIATRRTSKSGQWQAFP